MKSFARILGWLMLASVAFVTICPINLRPLSGEPLWFEQSAAFFLFALVFAIGYQTKRLTILFFFIFAAGITEAAQVLQPSRHARLSDFIMKAIGCGLGWLLAYAATESLQAYRKSKFGNSASR